MCFKMLQTTYLFILDNVKLTNNRYNEYPVLLDNTTFNHYYYTFNTKLDNTNIYLDLPLTSLNKESLKWSYLSNSNNQIWTDEYEDEHDRRVSFLPSLHDYKQSSISNFFSTNMVDVPRCFKKSESLRKVIFNKPHLKLLHILMRHGKKEQIFARIFRTIISNRLQFTRIKSNSNSRNWLTWLPLFTNNTLITDATYRIFLSSGLKLDNLEKTIKDDHLIHPETLDNKAFWESPLNKYKPIFAFKVQKVDKSTRKHSKGKSGKYVILWKYVPVYRRIYTVLRWLIQDISFQKAHKFETRFARALDLLKKSPKKTTIAKCRNFTHNFVFKSFKKTLLRTLQTVS